MSLMLPLIVLMATAPSPTQGSIHELHLAPDPFHVHRQASSYDRASTAPGLDTWWANRDSGHFIRTERVGSRTEFVMADLTGPGLVMRIWSANPEGIIRFYFDGEPRPRLELPMTELLGGTHPSFPPHVAYVASMGWNLYASIPYARSLKITADFGRESAPWLFYLIGYDTYPQGTQVRPWTPGPVPLADPRPSRERRVANIKRPLLPGGSVQLSSATGGHVVRQMRVRLRPLSIDMDETTLAQEMRRVRLLITADGEPCVDVPLTDFFVSSHGLVPFESELMSVDRDGWMTSRFPMPYRNSMQVVLRSTSQLRFQAEVELEYEPQTWTERSMLFRSQWQGFEGPTRPFRDLSVLDATGRGVFVGFSMAISNPVPDWWGEGDERIFIDGEAFPSLFGTGTEDYFGYAWASPEPFMKPFHGQVRCDGPANKGHTTLYRWHVLDRLPFQNRLRFDIELWHWAVTDVAYSRTAYWYSKPGGSGPVPVEEKYLAFMEFPETPREPGVLEGEDLPIVARTGGNTHRQVMTQTSSYMQLWWYDVQIGDMLALEVEAPASGTYEVRARLCFARDYGMHEIGWAHLPHTVTMDFYAPTLYWREVSLGQARLVQGPNTLKVRLRGHHPLAQPRGMFGVDWIRLIPVGNR